MRRTWCRATRTSSAALVVAMSALPGRGLGEPLLEVRLDPRKATDRTMVELVVAGQAGCIPSLARIAVDPDELEHMQSESLPILHVLLASAAECAKSDAVAELRIPLGRPRAGNLRVVVDLAEEPSRVETWGRVALLEARVLRALPDRLELHDGRFVARALWSDGGSPRKAEPTSSSSSEGGFFHFFAPDNYELMLKVLPGCDVNGSYWVAGGASTTLAHRIEVEDVWSGVVWVREQPGGAPARSFLDVETFPCDSEARCTGSFRGSASSPREDRRAEELAAFLSDGPFAEDHVYARVKRDLDAIAAIEPATAGFWLDVRYLFGSVLLELSPADRPAFIAGNVPCLFRRLGESVATPSGRLLIVSWPDRPFDSRKVIDSIRSLPEVEDAYVDGYGYIPEYVPPELCVERDGDRWTYYFLTGTSGIAGWSTARFVTDAHSPAPVVAEVGAGSSEAHRCLYETWTELEER